MSNKPRILLVDDDPQALESTRKILEFSGFEVSTAFDGQSALDQVRPSPGRISFDLIITDVRMPRLGGLEFLRALSLCGETMPVILMTAFGRVEDAVWAMKLGAVDFLTKPFKRQALLASVEAALKRVKARNSENANSDSLVPASSLSSHSSIHSTLHPSLHSSLHSQAHASGDPLIGHSQAMRDLKDLIRRVSPTHASVLLSGESGTGKELVARCLHQQSTRAQAKFIALNCAAVPEQLIESELFGFEKGAFSGATRAKEGLFEAAHGGSLLLDEIGDMPFPLQAKLLRVLQEGEVRRIGATTSKKIDVRVIAASHKNLKQCVQEGTFRQDLLYRLEVIGIHVPPLRERTEDISDLAHFFLNRASQRHGKDVQEMSEATIDVLMAHSWPGNVRELSNVIERAVVLVVGNQITPSELPPHLLSGVVPGAVSGMVSGSPGSHGSPGSGGPHGAKPSSSPTIEVPLGTSLKDVEELLIRKTLEATSGDKNMTAKLLGINSRTIYRKLDKRGEKEPEPG